MNDLAQLKQPTRFLFFTGKSGVGKTSLSCAAALTMADQGKGAPLVSTDPASNLDEMLGAGLSDQPVAIPGAQNLPARNIDPDKMAEDDRRRVMEQLGPGAAAAERALCASGFRGPSRPRLPPSTNSSGCWRAGGAGYDHVICDTAPTGHTLRLLSLPRAWTGFFSGQ